MASGMFQRNPDGSWSPAEPIGWQHVPGGDWEVYRPGDKTNPYPGRYYAELFDEDVLIGVASARTRLGLAWQMRRAIREARRG